MNLTNKDFIVFCFIQDIEPDEESYKLYESYFCIQYKNIDNLYDYILAVQNIDPSLIIKEAIGCTIDSKHYTYLNGNFTFSKQINELDYNSLPQKAKDNCHFNSFTKQYMFTIASWDIERALNELIDPINIELLNPPTYADLLKYPYEVLDEPLPYSCFGDWNTFGDIGDFCYQYPNKLKDQGLCETRSIKSFCFDGRRTWELGYILYKGEPILFYYGAGRESRDSYGHTIVNESLYNELCNYLIKLSKEEQGLEQDIGSLNDTAYINFYGHNLLTSKFKEHY